MSASTGQQDGAKVVPLAAAAMELLSGLPRTSTYVLPAAKGDGHYVGLQKDWERIRVRAGLQTLRLHDLRHSFASFAVADGHTLLMVGKVLGHKQAGPPRDMRISQPIRSEL